MSLQSCHTLLALDFDHTVVDDNTDTIIWRLAEGGVLPARLIEKRRLLPWTQFVQEVLTHLQEIGRSAQEILDCIASVPLTPGIPDLLSALSGENVMAIIISDSNSLFIDRILVERGLNQRFDRIFTNPARVDHDRIILEPYESQKECSICSENMCKGGVLRRYLDAVFDPASVRPRVMYVGDGRNDWCAARQLASGDLVCPRSGYRLDELVRREPDKIRAQVVPWITADSLISHMFKS